MNIFLLVVKGKKKVMNCFTGFYSVRHQTIIAADIIMI